MSARTEQATGGPRLGAMGRRLPAEINDPSGAPEFSELREVFHLETAAR